MTSVESLRNLPYFEDLPDELLKRVAEVSEMLELEADRVIIEEGSESEEMYVVVEGELVVTKRTGDKEVTLAVLSPGEVVGEIALLDEAPRTATVTTTVPSTVLRVPAAAFGELLSDAQVVRRMFRTVTSRLRGIENTLRHEERMSALGKMAAQLMHELNNPAAAVGRSSGELERVYDLLSEEAAVLAQSVGGGVEVEAPEPPELSPLEMSELENTMADYLEDAAVPDPWDLAPGLVAAGWQPEILQSSLSGTEEELRPHLLRWIGLRATAGQLINEISMAAGRVSELVRVIKEYSYLDQAPVQEVSIADGIRDTLTLLKHKLKHVSVTTSFPDDLNRVEVPGRDLNQVWTNLIDNAADALSDGDTLTITARNEGDGVVVEVADSGSGIPDDIIDRVFDPFFTTKEPGKGTGLGLHTVHTIVSRMGGDIRVSSSSSGTIFTVQVPARAG